MEEKSYELSNHLGNVHMTLSDYRRKEEEDLVSGNVRRVTYQKDKPDQYIHRYEYDSDNRLRHVYTSRDGELWEEDAWYDYYDHGPLARTELGEYKVAGQDYYYTLQGWLKGVNMPGTGIDDNPDIPQYDPGQDGYREKGNPHRDVARDRFGFALSYYENDYAPINGMNMMAVDDFQDIQSSDLYNGNIRAATYDYFPGKDDEFEGLADFGIRGVGYSYDQLNRLTGSENYEYDGTIFSPDQRYETEYSYDANGNIETLQRLDHNGAMLDDLEYFYDKPSNNRLMEVSDHEGTTSVEGDFENNSTYSYDAIGNLTSDSEADIEEITWTTSGKVREVQFEDGTKDESGNYHADLEFHYDASDNRIMKTIIPRDADGNLKSEENCWERIFYIRDAQGNVMATMEQRPENSCEAVLYMDNFYVYGSERLGKEKKSDIEWNDLENGWKDSIFVRVMEEKSYELSNHLGNVHMTLSDYRRKEEDGLGVAYYSQVKSASDYYPFGQLLTEGNYSAEDYRFGFNGKEMDNEVKGTGNSYDFGARLYSPRIGRWMSVDPKAKKYPMYSPFLGFANQPIAFIDNYGEENVIYIVNLQGDNPKINTERFIKNTNQKLRNMGLNTKLVMVKNPSEFNPKYLDKTDAYGVIGQIKNIKDYINDRDPKSYESTFDEWKKNDETNPEKSEYKGDAFGMYTNGVLETSKSLDADKGDVATLLGLHALGHNAGIQHVDEQMTPEENDGHPGNTAIMMSGALVQAFMVTGIYKGKKVSNPKFSYIQNYLKPKYNKVYIREMIERFGDKPASDNYKRNREDANRVQGKHDDPDRQY